MPEDDRHILEVLHGRTIRERAEALIHIAHPKFRDELYGYCERTRWLQRPARNLTLTQSGR